MSEQTAITILIVIGFLQLGIIFILLRRENKSSGTGDEINRLREEISEKLSSRLDTSQKMMVEAIQKQSAQSNRIVADITKQLTEISQSNKQVVSVTDELKTLQNI